MPNESVRIALVTGGSRGIGAAIARRLANDGLRVAITGRNQSLLERVAAQIEGTPFVADLAEPGVVDSLLQRIEAQLGPVDVLVNNAGVAFSAPIDRTSDEDWDRIMAVNVSAVFRLCRRVLPSMIERGHGRIINVASNAGLTGYAYTVAYCASKHALVGLTRALALDVARAGVTVNAVCPGWVESDMSSEAVDRIAGATGKSRDEAKRVLENMNPQRRMMTAEEIAHAVAVLVPESARGIHGQCIVVDGGQVMK